MMQGCPCRGGLEPGEPSGGLCSCCGLRGRAEGVKGSFATGEEGRLLPGVFD